MPHRYLSGMLGILVAFIVPWPASAMDGEASLNVTRPGLNAALPDVPPPFKVIERKGEDRSQKESPPNPDIIDLLLTNQNVKSPNLVDTEVWRFNIGKGKVNKRQKPAQSDVPVTSDAHPQVSSRPVKPVSDPLERPDQRESNKQHPAARRPAGPEHDHDTPVLHDPATDAPSRKDKSVSTPARREILVKPDQARAAKSTRPAPEKVKAIAPIVAPTAASDREAAVRSRSEMGDRWTNDKRSRWRERYASLTDEDKQGWRDRHRDGQRLNETSPPQPLNTTPLTEDEIKKKVQENNIREKARVEEERHWRHHKKAVNNPGGWGDGQWHDHYVYVPAYDRREETIDRQNHFRGYSFYDPVRRIYYYPEEFSSSRVVVLPTEFDPLSVDGRTYYYSGGTFYRRDRSQFSDVPAPLGALVTSLPSGQFAEVKISGTRYATYNGVYYKKVAGGYEVTAPPEGFEGVLIMPAPKTVNGEAALIVSIPDPQDNSQFIDIKLIRSGDGFRGPKDEYYPQFPKIEQLRKEYVYD
jgi:hypothetical protein